LLYKIITKWFDEGSVTCPVCRKDFINDITSKYEKEMPKTIKFLDNIYHIKVVDVLKIYDTEPDSISVLSIYSMFD
jgi:hypothetical protein